MRNATGDEKDAGGNVIEISDAVDNLYFVSGTMEVFTVEPKLHELPVGNLSKAAAHWSAFHFPQDDERSMYLAGHGKMQGSADIVDRAM